MEGNVAATVIADTHCYLVVQEVCCQSWSLGYAERQGKWELKVYDPISQDGVYYLNDALLSQRSSFQISVKVVKPFWCMKRLFVLPNSTAKYTRGYEKSLSFFSDTKISGLKTSEQNWTI